jgi:hypothetical protein
MDTEISLDMEWQYATKMSVGNLLDTTDFFIQGDANQPTLACQKQPPS